MLVLEDDDGIRMALRMALEDAGYLVVECARAEEALRAVEEEPVDLMLVDLMLGGIDGFTFISRVRSTTHAPIVVVSAREGTGDIVNALEVGADDYVTKPFVVEEVQARLKALLRRPSIAEPETGRDRTERVRLSDGADPLVMDLAAATVSRGGQRIHLTKTEYRLLEVLTANAGRVLPRRTLLERVWEHGFYGDERLVDVHVRRLRSKIEPHPSEPQLLITVRGLGYRLDLP
ncbi:response regulator transcription factor [Nocardioides sp.]|uniref:response regulator transcription factor n=1 Tax=Nocardioides sp. TaxID=35761 RepID=UPI003D108DE3